jgi:MFS family permease
VYGRFEAFTLSVVIIVLGFTLSSLAGSILTFGIGQCLLSIGQVGIQFLEAIVAADNSSLTNRGLATALTMTPFAFTVFAVAPIAAALLPDKWRVYVFPFLPPCVRPETTASKRICTDGV